MTLFFVLSSLLSAPVHAQSAKTVNKASKMVKPGQDPEKLRRAFQMLSDEIRANPDLASPAGLWLRADAAALLAIQDEKRLASAVVALESYERAAAMRNVDRELLVYTQLEGFLHDHAQAYESATTQEQRLAALEAAQLYIRADDIRVKLDVSKPVERARRYILAVSAAKEAGEVRAARKLFEELDLMGGFIEALAIDIARFVEEQESPHQAFLFMLALQERHPKHRKLLKSFTDLCLQHGWNKEAREALEKSVPHYDDNYEDQMMIAGYFDALEAPEEAMTHYEKALAHAPRGFDANWLYATLLQRIADMEEDPERAMELREKAKKSLTLVLESNPESQDALQALAVLEEALAAGPELEDEAPQ